MIGEEWSLAARELGTEYPGLIETKFSGSISWSASSSGTPYKRKKLTVFFSGLETVFKRKADFSPSPGS